MNEMHGIGVNVALSFQIQSMVYFRQGIQYIFFIRGCNILLCI